MEEFKDFSPSISVQSIRRLLKRHGWGYKVAKTFNYRKFTNSNVSNTACWVRITRGLKLKIFKFLDESHFSSKCYQKSKVSII